MCRASTLPLIGLLLWTSVQTQALSSVEEQQWTPAQAAEWSAQFPWIVGFNYAPRSAINQLEMWQEDTFDPVVIDQELGWAADIGFTMARVFLHHLLWQEDAETFTKRIDKFLAIADANNIDVMFVLFDDVWNPLPQLGPQPLPRPGVHNSGWVQSPGAAILRDLNRHDELESYVRGILSRYGQDNRVAIWDLYNEPGNLNAIAYGSVEVNEKPKYSLNLLAKAFAWARDENPTQPLTSGVWRLKNGRWRGADKGDDGAALFDFMLQNSDIISFHSYENAANTDKAIQALEVFERPMICTEYLARGRDSTFESLMPLFASKNIGAMHWGFVSGKTQTIYPWRSWVSVIRFWDGLFSDEPDPWHHDLLEADGSPYRLSEVEFIRTQITSAGDPIDVN
ncbi:MAG: cellulase family glycosylhydrolase [Porticoccaceae bacterium]|jgi:hypothetical protein|nr:cellulase family glycosylhydrolase [Porticoccaceae bacterium]MBT6798741.1 cellulase family glycosylhydrolase [Porticoccaceae bacterium]